MKSHKTLKSFLKAIKAMEKQPSHTMKGFYQQTSIQQNALILLKADISNSLNEYLDIVSQKS